MFVKGHLRTSRWLGIALLSTALAACGGSQGDLEKWVAEIKARPAPPLDPLPVMQQFETFEYDAQNLRDPFSEVFNGGEGSGPRPDAGRRKQTLEQFPLDSLDMVGTLGNGRSLVALLMALDTVTYRVHATWKIGEVAPAAARVEGPA